MPTVQKFEDLEIWQSVRAISNEIFEITKFTMLNKDYDFKNQMNRSSASIMDNIAEGFGRARRLEFIQFLGIALGSLDELKSELYRCLNRNYITQESLNYSYSELYVLCKKIKAFMTYLNKKTIKVQKFKDRL